MTVADKASLVRQLVPKSYHFDGYNELNCQNSRDKPFFADNVIQMGEYYLTVRIENKNQIVLEYGSVCPKGEITFKPYKLSLETYVSKLQKAIQDGCDFISFEIFPQYNYDSCSRVCSFKNEDCTAMRKEQPKKVLAAVSFNTSEVKKALAMYFEIIKTTEGDDNIMRKSKNNIFGMNFEMGLSKDPNIAATLMGVAVRSPENGNWYTFDIANNTRKNLANMKMGNFPIFLLPIAKLEVGDLIKKDGKYYYVKSVNPNNTITLIGAADGVIREMLKEESIIPGMTLYVKVVAFDTKSLMDVGSKENMGGNVIAAMCMMNWANGNKDEFSLDSINDDSFNGLGSCMPMLMAMNGGDIGSMFANSEGGINFPMLMMLGSGEGETNDMTMMLVLSQLLGGNQKNPISEMLSPVISDAPVSEEKVICEKCNETYPAGTNFCSKCGSATKALATTCKKCGAVLMDGAMFCHKCGAKASADTCPNCGKEVSADENFCSGCGTNLKAETVAPADAKAEETPAEGK